MRTLLVAVALVLGAAGCRTGLGESCGADAPCPEGLVCNVPAHPEDLERPLGVCDYALRTEGEVCTQAAECEGAFTCSNHFNPGSRYGACVPRRATGEPCFQDRDCLVGKCLDASGEALDGTCAG